MKIKQLIESPTVTAYASCALLLVVWLALKFNVLPASAHDVVADVRNVGLNAADLEMQTRNYYREVSDVNVGEFTGFGKFLTKLGLKPPRETPTGEPVGLSKTSIVYVEDRPNKFLPWELKPSEEIVFLGKPFRTNRWGMRDREYEKTPPDGTFRIALVGASNSMGNGVTIEETYSELIEERLNAELADEGFENYEVLNFSVGGYDLTDKLFVATEKIPPFEPDLLLFIVIQRDLSTVAYQRVAERLAAKDPQHYDFLKQLAEEAGVQPGDSDSKLRQRLRPFRARLLRDSIEELQRTSERTGIPVVAVVLNLVVGPIEPDLADAAKICETTNIPTLRVFTAYEGHTENEIYLAPSDRHPKPLGHRLIADELYTKMLEHPTLGPMIRGETRKD